MPNQCTELRFIVPYPAGAFRNTLTYSPDSGSKPSSVMMGQIG